jgi:hypothetical protein
LKATLTLLPSRDERGAGPPSSFAEASGHGRPSTFLPRTGKEAKSTRYFCPPRASDPRKPTGLEGAFNASFLFPLRLSP